MRRIRLMKSCRVFGHKPRHLRTNLRPNLRQPVRYDEFVMIHKLAEVGLRLLSCQELLTRQVKMGSRIHEGTAPFGR